MSSARAGTRTARSGDERTNYEATARNGVLAMTSNLSNVNKIFFLCNNKKIKTAPTLLIPGSREEEETPLHRGSKIFLG